MTSFGNGAAASSSNGITAWSGVRSASAARAPCSSVRRQRVGELQRAADQRQEEREVLARARVGLPERPDLIEELLDRGDAAGDPERRRLAHRQRREHRPPRRSEQRHDAAVGMTDEVIAFAELRCDLVRLHLEVDPLQRRPGRVTAPREEHALEPVRQSPLLQPGRLGISDAPVDEDDARHK